jgi:hypothetical protein
MAYVHGRPDRRRAQRSPVLVSLAVTTLFAITLATLCPIGLRPHMAGANAERFGAYFVLGAFAALASGRRTAGAAMLVVLAAFALEYAQHLAPGRHAHLSDAMVKALGGVAGALAAQLAFPARRWLARAMTSAARPLAVRPRAY